MAATLLLEQIRETVAAWPVGKRFDLGRALDRLALMLVSDLALGEAPMELIGTAAKTLEGLRRAARPMGLVRKALAPRSRSGFQSLRSVAEPYLATKFAASERVSPASKSCVFARMAAACSSRGRQLDGDEVRDEMMTILVAMMAGFSCGLKHAFYWILSTPGIQARLSDPADGSLARAAAGDISSQAVSGRRVQGSSALLPGYSFCGPEDFNRRRDRRVEITGGDDVRHRDLPDSPTALRVSRTPIASGPNDS